MKQKVDAGSSGPTVLASGGARMSRTWTITGTLQVRESETEGSSHADQGCRAAFGLPKSEAAFRVVAI